MSDGREEWFKLVLEELRKNSEKQDKIAVDIGELRIGRVKDSVHIERNTKDLAQHIHRTNLLEEMHKAEAVRLDIIVEKISPLTVVGLMKRIVLIAGGVATIAGAAIALSKLLGF